MPTFNDSVKQIGKSDATSKTTVSLVNVRAKLNSVFRSVEQPKTTRNTQA